MSWSPPHLLDLTRDLKQLTRLATTDEGIGDLLERGLDWLARLAPYDLATVFSLEGDALVVRAARGPLADRVRHHTLPLARFPSIRDAFEKRRARAFTEHDHRDGDGDPFDGVLDLPPGHACMVVPLVAGDRNLGALTLDRTHCETYSDVVVNLVEVYGQVLALAMENASQRVVLQRLGSQQEERVRLLELELGASGLGDNEAFRSASPAMQRLLQQARQVAGTLAPVLLLGETGTGKEWLARALHQSSPRATGPFVKINCAAIPSGLLESELFGHIRGAFTGATKDRPGRFSVANGGTLLLDEIGEMPLDLQAKLLRVLQENMFEPVGSDRTVRVDVRILAATHVDLAQAIAARTFREDLYYRLNVFPLRTIPLRERTEDLPRLCEVLLAEQARRSGRHVHLGPGVVDQLKRHRWPGNIRELANVLERATILSPDDTLRAETFEVGATTALFSALSLPRSAVARSEEPLVSMEEMQRRYIQRVLTETAGKVYGEHGAAAVLRMNPSTLHSRMKRLGMLPGTKESR